MKRDRSALHGRASRKLIQDILRDAALVVPAIAQRLDLHQPGIAPLREAMHGFLSSRSILLVVDNLEHLPEAGVEVAAMLATAPRLQVLATSRSPLRVQGEQMYPVLPLAPRLAAAVDYGHLLRSARRVSVLEHEGDRCGGDDAGAGRAP